MHRTEDEKNSLALFRFKNWVSTVNNDLQQLQAIQDQHKLVVDHLSYSLLEAREEQEKLIAAGMTKEEIEKVAVLPQVPLDPLTILKTARDTTPSVEDLLSQKQG
jgi:hypothetical protein